MQPLILLHGALGSRDQFSALSGALAGKFELHSINFSGHGGESLPAEPFSIPLFARDVIQYLDKRQLTAVSIFGYSMGGYVGAWLARHHPERVLKLVTLATKFHWDAETAAREAGKLDADTIRRKVPAFAATLEKIHAPQNWTQVLHKTREFMISMGDHNPLRPEDFPALEKEVLIMLGDRDKMVSMDETTDVYKRIPCGQLCILPATPHSLEQVDADLLSTFIQRFC